MRGRGRSGDFGRECCLYGILLDEFGDIDFVDFSGTGQRCSVAFYSDVSLDTISFGLYIPDDTSVK